MTALLLPCVAVHNVCKFTHPSNMHFVPCLLLYSKYKFASDLNVSFTNARGFLVKFLLLSHSTYKLCCSL